MPPSAMTGTLALPRRLGAIHDRGQLRHADAGDDARRADRAGADADLDPVGAGADQRLGPIGGGDVAGDQRDLVGDALQARDLFEHGLRMAVRGVDDDAIDASVDQHFGALEAFVPDRRGGRDAQPPFAVFRGQRMLRGLVHVLDRDETNAAKVVVDDDELFETVLVQQAPGFVLAYAFAHGDQRLGHQLGDRLQRIIGEAHVAIGQNTEKPRRLAAGAALDDGNPRNAVAAHQRQGVSQRFVRENGDRIDHHPALVAFDLAHFLGLFVDRIKATIDRYGDRFTERIFTENEIAYCTQRRVPSIHFAGRFAAKEAAMKALGTGHSQGVLWRDVEVIRLGGPPQLALHGGAARRLARIGGQSTLLTITHSEQVALAEVLILNG